MRILSIDIGIKNLAYCLIDLRKSEEFRILAWDVVNLCGPEPLCNQTVIKKKISNPCTKLAAFSKANQTYCRTCANRSPYIRSSNEFNILERKRTKLSELIALANTVGVDVSQQNTKTLLIKALTEFRKEKCLEPIIQSSAANLNLITAGRAMNNYFDTNDILLTADTVIIENQISPIAARMKTMQGMVAQYFIMKNIKDIKFVSAMNKLKPFIGNNKTTYNERKKLSIQICTGYLQHQNMDDLVQKIKTHKKKDDLADSFLQGIVFLSNKGFFNITYSYPIN